MENKSRSRLFKFWPLPSTFGRYTVEREVIAVLREIHVSIFFAGPVDAYACIEVDSDTDIQI